MARPKRYSLSLPQQLWDELLEAFPDDHMVTVIRKALKLLLLAKKVQESGGRLIIREHGMDQEIMLI